MRKLLKYTGLQLIFWLIFFALNRAVFLIYYSGLISDEGIGFKEAIMSFYHAFKLDLSTASYIMLFTLLMFFVQSMIKKNRFLLWLHSMVNYLIIIAYAFLTGGEMGVYEEWKTKLSYKAMAYFQHPTEVYNSTSGTTFFSLFALVGIVIVVSIYVYSKWIRPKSGLYVKGWLKPVLYFIVLLPVSVITMRGGLQAIPITQSEVYYSKHNILNLASVNNGYNMLLSVMETGKFLKENPFQSMPDAQANAIVNELYEAPKDTTQSILKVEKPNIVLVILESWSGDLIESLGGKPGITPEFAKLEKEGLLFTNLYASGNRSQQAMATLFSGFPAIPVTTITNHPDKYHSLPSMIKDLKKDNYTTSFYFGGQLIYGNIKAYMVFNEFDRIVEGEDLDPELPRGKLGVHDGLLFPEHVKDLNTEKEPFFSGIFTLSSHSPYDQPMDPVIDWAGKENPFINSAYYTDKSIGEYIELAKKQDWYKNTLFVFVADHSHNTYRNWPLQSFEYHKIPLLFYGPALKDEYRGVKNDRLVSNDDITATLLTQLGLPTAAYPYSKDMFNPTTNNFAYFELNDGFGWKTDKGEFIYNKQIDKNYKLEVAPQDKDSLILQGKAYSQKVFRDFMDL